MGLRQGPPAPCRSPRPGPVTGGRGEALEGSTVVSGVMSQGWDVKPSLSHPGSWPAPSSSWHGPTRGRLQESFGMTVTFHPGHSRQGTCWHGTRLEGMKETPATGIATGLPLEGQEWEHGVGYTCTPPASCKRCSPSVLSVVGHGSCLAASGWARGPTGLELAWHTPWAEREGPMRWARRGRGEQGLP